MNKNIKRTRYIERDLLKSSIDTSLALNDDLHTYRPNPYHYFVVFKKVLGVRQCVVELLICREKSNNNNFFNLFPFPSKHKPFVKTFIQRRPNVIDVSLPLYRCYKNVLCLLGFS